jgi:predicted aspartyl protease
MSRSWGLLLAGCLGVIFAAATVSAQQDVHTAPAHTAPLDIRYGKPYVMVMLNGHGPFRFIIDTGTGGDAFVSAEVASVLGLPEVGQFHLSDPSGKGSRKVPMVLIQSLQVAGVEFRGVKAAVHNVGSNSGDCQGLLGFVLFHNYLLTLDYPNRQIKLTEGDLKADGGRSVLPFQMPDGIPVVTLDVGGTRIDAQLDSGGAGFSLPESMAVRMKLTADSDTLINAHSLSTSFQVRGATLASDARLGRYTFKHPYIEINPAFPLANFGSCPMQNFAVTFDQKNALVRFEASKSVFRLPATPVPIRMMNAPSTQPADPALVPIG